MESIVRNAKTRNRGYLPHLESPNARYFVTFRLADSLPQEVLESYQFERDNIVATAAQMNRPLSDGEVSRLVELYSQRIENYLDQGAGVCGLREPRAAKIVFDAIRFFHPVRYELFAWCIMPNHVHVVFKPIIPHDLASILHSWKSFTSKEVNRALGRTGALWMPEYYDHLIRDEAEFRRICRYVLENPLKAGLKDWQWVASLLAGCP